MALEYELHVHNSIDELSADQIDSISDDPFFTYGWFKTLERQKDFKVSPFYIAVSTQGKLVAFTPCFIDLFDQYFSYGPYVVPFMKRLLTTGNKLGLWQKHILLCYSPFCFRSKVLIDEDFKNPIIFGLIFQKINEICRKERILFSSFLFVSEFDILLAETLQYCGYSKFPWFNTLYLDIPWSSFEAYLASCGYEIRKDIRREIKKFNHSGLDVESDSNTDGLSERLSVLYANLFQKYNRGPSPYGSSFLRNLSKFAGDKIQLFTAKKDNLVVAFCLLLRHKETLDAFMFGCDYNSRTKTDFAYFNLTYYEPIKWAIKKGIKRIFFRLAAENVKLRIGCKTERNYCFVKCHNNLLMPFTTAYVREKYSDLT
jgi:predicted N-acyltransferase